MRLREFWKNETGAVAVVVALFMVVLIGFTSLAVDYGYWASQKRELQNTADAAALAAASKLDGKASALSAAAGEAGSSAKDNGLETPVPVVAFSPLDNYRQVSVSVNRTVDTFFSQVLTGKTTQTISATAVASASSIFGGYDYALFGGSIDEGYSVDVNGNNNNIDGDVHSNSDIEILHTDFTSGSEVTMAGDDAKGVSGVIPAAVRDMPTLDSLISYAKTLTLTSTDMASIQSTLDKQKDLKISGSSFTLTDVGFDALVSYVRQKAIDAGQDPDADGVMVYIQGTVDMTASNGSITFPISFISSGDLTFHGSDVASDPSCPVLLSSEGDVTFEGGTVNFAGTIFAPDGTVHLNGNGGEKNITGRILGDVIEVKGGNMNISYDGSTDSYLPATKVRLIK